VKIFDVRGGRVEEAIEEAARVIFAGGTLVYPDDCGYVLAGDPRRPAACATVYAMATSRDAHDVAICVASATELLEYAPGNALAQITVRKKLETPVAFLLPRPSFFPAPDGSETAAFRVPEDALARAVLERCGPLVACATAYDGSGFEGLPQADLVLERGEVPAGSETSVVDLTDSRSKDTRHA
jgi:tRNA A37 threonylcarbamoyladenosine synthetase subunit TsaC/SUA5/YrdC